MAMAGGSAAAADGGADLATAAAADEDAAGDAVDGILWSPWTPPPPWPGATPLSWYGGHWN